MKCQTDGRTSFDTCREESESEANGEGSIEGMLTVGVSLLNFSGEATGNLSVPLQVSDNTHTVWLWLVIQLGDTSYDGEHRSCNRVVEMFTSSTTDATKERILNDFRAGRVRVVVATVAFGPGEICRAVFAYPRFITDCDDDMKTMVNGTECVRRTVLKELRTKDMNPIPAQGDAILEIKDTWAIHMMGAYGIKPIFSHDGH
ncbi:hypothetical protein DPMN_057902 [Dreissena polymorpha]|uniref:Uncharacterized protein n=1 Tax=Dreissena polymorpha TaxID=45954 RepID=A0A9D4C0R6_DREPO|nr:hypothetical protein DPMN_057902 [Dreissena polymorpha]